MQAFLNFRRNNVSRMDMMCCMYLGMENSNGQMLAL